MPPAQQQQPQNDNSMGPIWIIVGCFVLGWAIWYAAHAYIVAVVLKIKLVEAELLSVFTDRLIPLQAAIKAIPSHDYGGTNFETLVGISEKVGLYLRYPLVVILAVLAIIIYLHSPAMKFKKIYSMQRLLDEEGRGWPQTGPVAKLDLIKIHPDEGTWAMASTPMQFAKKYRLLTEERNIPSGDVLMSQVQITAVLVRQEAYKVLTLQLGNYWKGPEALPIYAQAIFAAMAARIDGNAAGSAKILAQISASAVAGKLDFSGVKDLVAKHKNNKNVVKIMQSHAFVLTVMASLLQFTRNDGVFATADFLWLKPVDRVLWYMMNTVGRKTPFVEVAGPYCHWLAEQRFGRDLQAPIVDEAVDALELAIKEVLYKSDDNS